MVGGHTLRSSELVGLTCVFVLVTIRVPYSALTDLWSRVELESKRLKIIEMTRDFIRSVIALSPDELLPTIYLLTNQIAPAFEGKELGIGDGVLTKAVSEATGLSLAQLRDKVKKSGDLGTTAQASKSAQKTLFKPKPLTVSDVYRIFQAIADMSGKASINRRKEQIKNLLVRCQGMEVCRNVGRSRSPTLMRFVPNSFLCCSDEVEIYGPSTAMQNANRISRCDGLQHFDSRLQLIADFDCVRCNKQNRVCWLLWVTPALSLR